MNELIIIFFLQNSISIYGKFIRIWYESFIPEQEHQLYENGLEEFWTLSFFFFPPLFGIYIFTERASYRGCIN